MSQFLDAVRAQALSDVRCPSCEAVNIPGRKDTIEIDLEREVCVCTQCGHGGSLKAFTTTIQKET